MDALNKDGFSKEAESLIEAAVCYEGEAKYFNNIKAVLNYPNGMDSVCWLLRECQKKALLK
ncbi:MAG TPA: hypothetical protein VJN02_10490 [Gammaproteobacteria bacterium]|nr:hypothetical protein [Gammaproteobacteria bacterium]